MLNYPVKIKHLSIPNRKVEEVRFRQIPLCIQTRGSEVEKQLNLGTNESMYDKSTCKLAQNCQSRNHIKSGYQLKECTLYDAVSSYMRGFGVQIIPIHVDNDTLDINYRYFVLRE